MTFQPSQYSAYGASVLPSDDPRVQQILADARERQAELEANRPTDEQKRKAALALGVGIPVVIGFAVAGPFIIYPWAIKQFMPGWSYGKRVVAGFGVAAVLGALYRVGRK